MNKELIEALEGIRYLAGLGIKDKAIYNIADNALRKAKEDSPCKNWCTRWNIYNIVLYSNILPVVSMH